MVASSASWEPCQRGKPFATTSMRRSSETGTSRFMSARRTWRATLAPASRQTRATACSKGSARVASTPDVAQAVRWSPSGSSTPWQLHLRGASGRGSRKRRSRRTRNCALGMATSSRVGRTLRAREANCPACESSSARDAGVRSARCVSYARSSHAQAATRCHPRNGQGSSVRSGAGGTATAPEPFWRLVTNMAQLCLGVDCCGGRWQGPVALQGNVETGGRSRRCVAVNAGGAETEPSEPLSELGSAEAGGRKGGVSLFEAGGKAPGDSCIMFRCIVSREVGGRMRRR